MFRNWIVSVFVAIGLTLGCGGGKKIDVVNGVDPVGRQLYDGVHIWVKDMAKMPAAERQAYLRQAAPHLEQSVPYFLRQAGKMSVADRVERVQFLYGSLDDVKAGDKQGNVHRGYAKDQLIARVFIEGKKEPVDVFVQCLNGVFSLTPGDYDRLQDLGAYNVAERFTIEAGEGLVHHVDYPVAMDIAERHGLKLYRGSRQTSSREITVAEARRLENRTDQIQVTVQVYAGDVFDLNTMTYTPARH